MSDINQLISIVIPVFNESESIGFLLDEVMDVMVSHNFNFELIVVNDGSRDNTQAALDELALKTKELLVISLRKNYGQTAAMAAGFDNSKGGIVITLDGDLQNDPDDIPKLISEINKGYDLICGWRFERKDKLTNLLYMFIGPKIYSEERSNDDLVCVRGIEFKTNDEEFKIVETDFRGQTKYSTMISKLCDYGPRSDFIVRVVKDLIAENDEAQIMILAHNKNLLKYLHDSIIDRKIASAGYYVGGMKQKDLQETETKQVVIATYAMAAEGLDIKTLNTLVMATPKTDIVQSVGRILRSEHGSPIVIDVVDQHDLFVKQYYKRRAFYKNEGQGNSLQYWSL